MKRADIIAAIRAKISADMPTGCTEAEAAERLDIVGPAIAAWLRSGPDGAPSADETPCCQLAYALEAELEPWPNWKRRHG